MQCNLVMYNISWFPFLKRSSYEDSKSKETKHKALSWMPSIFLELTTPHMCQTNGQ